MDKQMKYEGIGLLILSAAMVTIGFGFGVGVWWVCALGALAALLAAPIASVATYGFW